MSDLDRRSFLVGAMGGIALPTGAYVLGAVDPPRFALTSYAQQGEDFLLQNIFQRFIRIDHPPTYIDIGAHDPIVGSNTYIFYCSGSRGILVEPNPDLTPKLRKTRPGDTVLEIGIGAVGEDREADYYIIEGDGQLNTFSEEVAKERGYKRVIKRTLVDINKVLHDGFGGRAPDLMSIDTEGYDLTILQNMDFNRYRPFVICAETLAERGRLEQRIIDLMRSKDYEVRAATWVNTIFVDNARLAKMYNWG